MLDICKKKWAENEKVLKESINKNLDVIMGDREDWDCTNDDYEKLLERTLFIIFDGYFELDSIHQVGYDNDYQGTLVFTFCAKNNYDIPTGFFATFVYYGSCSGCDTLQCIKEKYIEEYQSKNHEEIVKDLLGLCRDMVTRIVQIFACEV